MALVHGRSAGGRERWDSCANSARGNSPAATARPPDMETKDLDRLVSQIKAELPSEWSQWPGGWPGQIERALLDSVLSLRARYGGPETGVRGALNRWADHRGQDTLDDLAAVTTMGPGEALADILDNRQKLSGGALKAAGAIEAGRRLQEHGLRHAADVTASPELKKAWTEVKGLGEVSWVYFTMLLGTPDVKADVMIRRFVSRAIGEDATAARARTLVRGAARSVDVSPTALDHAIWDHERAAR